jgi:hypothetical protein
VVCVCGGDETGLQHAPCQLSEGACVAWGCLLLTQASKDALSHTHVYTVLLVVLDWDLAELQVEPLMVCQMGAVWICVSACAPGCDEPAIAQGR